MHPKLQFMIDRLTDVRVLADTAEQITQEVRRLAAAATGTVDELKGVYASLRSSSGSRRR